VRFGGQDAAKMIFATWAGGQNTYALRKAHTEAMVEFLLINRQSYWSPDGVSNYYKLPKGSRNHAADAIMQTFALLPKLLVPRAEHRRGLRVL